MAMKINKLEIENVKRVHAVKIEPTQNGLTLIGGKNNQGKTSVLDAIAWALGGEKFRPSEAKNKDSVIPPTLKVVMNNGLVVERKGKNSTLTVTDPSGNKSGQRLLDEFVSQLALDLPKFMEASDKEKAQTLLKILGIGDQLTILEQEEQKIYNDRRVVGQIADQKEKFAKEQPYFPEAPHELVSASDLIRQQQEILARNGENQRKRDQMTEIAQEKFRCADELKRLDEQIENLKKTRSQVLENYNQAVKDEEIAMKTVLELKDESTAELEENLANIEEVNRKVRANLDKDKAEEDARNHRERYDQLTHELNDVRKRKTDMLNGAELPLPELSILDGALVYKGQKWDNMSGSDRLKVATAIVRKLNPDCGFVLMDKLEQMDLDTLNEFGAWCETEGLQVIATRVSTGGECSIIIEDGYAVGREEAPSAEKSVKDWRNIEL